MCTCRQKTTKDREVSNESKVVKAKADRIGEEADEGVCKEAERKVRVRVRGREGEGEV